MKNSSERIMWKVGSDSATNEFGPNLEAIEHLAGQFSAEIQDGRKPAAVISGIYATGLAVMQESGRNNPNVTASMVASRGILRFYQAFESALSQYHIPSMPVFVTGHEIDSPVEGHRFHDTVNDCMNAGWLALINENPSTDNTELKKLVYGGDNDGLAEHAGDELDVDRICFLTGVAGLLNKKGKLVKVVDPTNAAWAVSLAKGPGPRGTGGMRSKVIKALETANKGRVAHIASSKAVFRDILSGEAGTIFLPAKDQSAKDQYTSLLENIARRQSGIVNN